jgi:hypothetical protein
MAVERKENSFDCESDKSGYYATSFLLEYGKFLALERLMIYKVGAAKCLEGGAAASLAYSIGP